MSGVFHAGQWYENTDLICRRCGHPVYESDNPEYSYQCFYCDEDMFSFEVRERDGLYLLTVMVARPVDGITVNGELEYLLDDVGKPWVFTNQSEAESYLLAHGFDSETLEHLYFVETAEEEELALFGIRTEDNGLDFESLSPYVGR